MRARGFTLIEMMIVVAIIAILAAIAIPALQGKKSAGAEPRKEQSEKREETRH